MEEEAYDIVSGQFIFLKILNFLMLVSLVRLFYFSVKKILHLRNIDLMISYQGKPWYELRLHDFIIVKRYFCILFWRTQMTHWTKSIWLFYTVQAHHLCHFLLLMFTSFSFLSLSHSLEYCLFVYLNKTCHIQLVSLYFLNQGFRYSAAYQYCG